MDENTENNTQELVGVQVNEDTCIGSGQCEMLEEETFYVDDNTVIASVIGTGMLPADRAKKVIDTCPTRAISVVLNEAGSEDE